MSEHTKGPWKWQEDPTSPGYFLVKGGETNVCIMQQKDSDMGMKSDPTRKEAIANACLISASPKLLAVAKRLEFYAEVQVRRHPDAEDAPLWRDLLEAIRDAEGKK